MLLRQSMNATGAGTGIHPLILSSIAPALLLNMIFSPFLSYQYVLKPSFQSHLHLHPPIISNPPIAGTQGLIGATATSSGTAQHSSMHTHGSAPLVPLQGASHAPALSMSPMHEEVIARQREALQQANNTANTSSSGNHTNQHLQGINMPLIEPRPGAAPYPHTLTTNPVNTHTHPINTHTLSTHIPYQHTLSTLAITRLINTPYSSLYTCRSSALSSFLQE